MLVDMLSVEPLSVSAELSVKNRRHLYHALKETQINAAQFDLVT